MPSPLASFEAAQQQRARHTVTLLEHCLLERLRTRPPADLRGWARACVRGFVGQAYRAGRKAHEAERVSELERFCQEGENKGKPGPCPGPKKEQAPAPKPSKPKPVADVAAHRPTKPEEREPDHPPKALPWKPPPPKVPRDPNKPLRPKGDLAQGKLGDQAEDMAETLGFRDILPEGQRSHLPGQVKKLGSSIDLEWDHTGRLYELKMCNTDAGEYRCKAKKSEKEAKLKFARRNKAKPYVMIGVRDADRNEIHFYAAKKPGMTGAAVSEENFDFVGTVKF